MNRAYELDQDQRAIPIAAPAKLSKAQLQALSRLNPYLSAYHIVLEWGAVVLAAMLCQHFWNPLLYAATVFFIASRHPALLILVPAAPPYRPFRNGRSHVWIAELALLSP